MHELHGVFSLFFGLPVEKVGQIGQTLFIKIHGNGHVLGRCPKFALNLGIHGVNNFRFDNHFGFSLFALIQFICNQFLLHIMASYGILFNYYHTLVMKASGVDRGSLFLNGR